MINSNWNRWIIASAGKHFESRRQGIPFFTEDTTPNAGESFQLRTIGPNWNQVSRTYYYGTVLFNILIKCPRTTDVYRIRRLMGIVESAFDLCIPVNKYGDTPNVDDRTMKIGELQRFPENDEDVRANNFGQVAPDTPLIQATVEGSYKIQLRT